MFDGISIFSHLTPIIVLIVLVILNHGFGRWRNEVRARRDAARLRIALRAELLALRDICDANLCDIAEGSPLLLSSRAAVAVYRGNIQRLVSLTEAEIPPLVAAFAWNDAAEGILAAASRGGPPAQKAEAERAALAALKAHQGRGCATDERRPRRIGRRGRNRRAGAGRRGRPGAVGRSGTVAPHLSALGVANGCYGDFGGSGPLEGGRVRVSGTGRSAVAAVAQNSAVRLEAGQKCRGRAG